jgi:GNAT superfamily N-acetyltransferase
VPHPGNRSGPNIGLRSFGFKTVDPANDSVTMLEAPYRRRLPGGLTVANTAVDHAEGLEALQRVVFPTLADEQRFKAAHYRRHLELFAEGQFVVTDSGRVVAATSTVRRHFDFGAAQHSFAEIIQGGWLTSHQPDGAWLYGADVSVDPDYRRRGLARALYAARQDLVWRLGLAGQVSAGMMPGYGALKGRMTAQAYLDRVRSGELVDPTLSTQQRLGFELRELLPDHLDDPVCDNYAVLIVLDASKSIPGAKRPRSTRAP